MENESIGLHIPWGLCEQAVFQNAPLRIWKRLRTSVCIRAKKHIIEKRGSAEDSVHKKAPLLFTQNEANNNGFFSFVQGAITHEILLHMGC